MFEREFEFTVHYPIEECEDRIQSLKMGGCFLRFLQPITVHLFPIKDEPYSEFYVVQRLGKNAGDAEIEGSIKQIKYSTTIVWGKVRIKNIKVILGFFTLLAGAVFIEGIYRQNWWTITFAVIWYSFAWLMLFSYRNRLLKILEKTLMRPKKKK